MRWQPAHFALSEYRFEVKDWDTNKLDEYRMLRQSMADFPPVSLSQFLFQIHFWYLVCQFCLKPLLLSIPISQLLIVGHRTFHSWSIQRPLGNQGAQVAEFLQFRCQRRMASLHDSITLDCQCLGSDSLAAQ